MSTTMVYNTNSQVGNQTGRSQQKPNGTEKSKHRPKSLQLAPFDPGELSRRLSVVQGTDDEVDPMAQPPVTPGTRNFSYNIGKGRQSSGSISDQLSPRTAGSKEPSPKDTAFAPKLVLPKEESPREPSPKDVGFSLKPSHSRKNSSAEPSPRRGSRRGSLKEMFTWRGTNYDPKEEESVAAAPTPTYRHVPKVAAAQFARTTTVETVSQKAAYVVTKPSTSPRPPPGPGAMSNGVMSPQDYNKMYRRAQSLCSGRPYERNGQFQLTILETTAEVDEEPAQHNPRHTFQAHLWNRSFEMGPENARRMSTGNIQHRQHMEMSGSMPQLRRNSNSMSQVRRDSVNSQLRRDSVNSFRRDSLGSQIRRDSSGSSAPLTPSRQDSLPTSAFRQDLDPMAHLRRESDPTPSSRRGSITSQQTAQLVAVHRNVDWSQSDEPVKPSSTGAQNKVDGNGTGNSTGNGNGNGNGKWSLKGRLGSKSSRGVDKERNPPLAESVSNSPPPKMHRPSLLSRLKRQSA